jgi:HK97 family phage major capsid protein
MRELEADKFFENAPAGQEARRCVEIDALAAVALYLRNGSNVTAEQAVAIRNAMSTTTTTEGGYTVPSEVASMVIDKLKAYGGMRDVAILSTSTGVAMNWPTSDGTADVGAIVGQNTARQRRRHHVRHHRPEPVLLHVEQDRLPLELIQDSAIDIVAYVVDRLATRIARIQNTHFTVGGGTTVPDGVIPKSLAPARPAPRARP